MKMKHKIQPRNTGTRTVTKTMPDGSTQVATDSTGTRTITATTPRTVNPSAPKLSPTSY